MSTLHIKPLSLLPMIALTAFAACSDPQQPTPLNILDTPDATQDMKGQPTAEDMRVVIVDTPDATADIGPDLREDMTTPPPTLALADGITITKIDTYQSVRIPLMQDGSAIGAELPLIAGRDTLFRAYVTLAQDRQTQIKAQLIEQGSDLPLAERELTLTKSSSEDDRSSVIELMAPGDRIQPTTTLQLRLLSASAQGQPAQATTPNPARWPQDGSYIAPGFTDAGGELTVLIVPFRYNTDGSGRLPDTSPEQLARIHALLSSLYPATRVNLTVREPVDWDSSTDWGDFNVELRALRQQDNAPGSTYYYGMISPDVDFNAYCNGRCTTGQSFTVKNADASSYRVGSGVGFTGERWAWTAAHEIGHMHGRGHATCGVSFWDRDRGYPHSGGDVGIWGWDIRQDALYAPDERTDFMGYCDDLWISDYTYQGLFDRMVDVKNLTQARALFAQKTYHPLSFGPNRSPKWHKPSLESDAHTGESVTIMFWDKHQKLITRAQAPLARLSHDEHKIAFIPEAPPKTIAISFAPTPDDLIPIYDANTKR